MTTPQFNALPPAPSRGDDGASFRSKADAFVAALQQFGIDGNAIADFVNAKVTDLDEHSSAAVNAAQVLNYQGEWDSGTNYSVGQSVTYAGEFWVANVANSNSTPSLVNANWQVVDSLDTADFDHLAQNKPQSYWLKRLLADTGRLVEATPSLDLDFEKGVYKIEGESDTFANTVTYTRADAVATKYHASGKLGTVGTDEPQFTYDPETKERYLLLEPSRTNELTESEFANGLADTTFNGGGAAATTFDGLFDGTGISLAWDGVTTSFAYKGFNLVDGTIYTLSAFVEMDDGGAPNFVGDKDFRLVLENLSQDVPPENVQHIGGGLYRVWVTYTGTASANTNVGVTKPASFSDRTFKFSGLMLEEGSYPTSYIKTTTAAATRAAPSATVPVGDLFNPHEGTFIVDWRGQGASDGDFSNSYVFAADDGTTDNRVAYFHDAATSDAINQNQGIVSSGGSGFLSPSFGDSNTERHISAISHSPLEIVFAQDGFSATDQGVASIQLTQLFLGRYSGGGVNETIRLYSIRYYPVALSESQLKALTSA